MGRTSHKKGNVFKIKKGEKWELTQSEKFLFKGKKWEIGKKLGS